MLYTKNGEPAGLVSNIQKYTIHDGPGIRTEIFFTGCTMRCIWCSNPETIQPRRRLGFYPSKCLSRDKCGWCVKSCPLGGAPLIFDADGVLERVEQAPECENCLKCADVCPPRAIKVWGELYTVAELMKIIEEDRGYYEKTGGGVTLSGGEVAMQWEFAELLLAECKKSSIHTCVETALNVPWEHAEAVFRNTDLVITDVKHMDSEKHRAIAGAGNELILENIKKTVALGKKLVIRTPIVPGYNAGEADIRKIGAFIRDELGGDIVAYQLLPYRKMGTEKYDSLGEPYPMGDYVPPERTEWEGNLLNLADILVNEYGLPALAGSSGKLDV